MNFAQKGTPRMKYKTASELLKVRHIVNMEIQFYIEKKGWKKAYVMPNVIDNLREKEIEGKRVTLTIEQAFHYEACFEDDASRGYEY
jgi:hypothetical protein